MMEEVAKIVRQALALGEDVFINEETSHENLPEWDSFGQIVLFRQLEEHYGLKFTFDEMIQMENVGQICKILMAKRRGLE